MRIISGKHKGRILKEFNGKDIRPTSDRAREALFNILFNKIIDSKFLDLFCGTGAIGIEAISRGAKFVVFVDNSKDSVLLCRQNLESIKEDGYIFLRDAISYLNECNSKFNIIFLDPPYNLGIAEKCLEIIQDRDLLLDNGIVIYEHRTSDKIEIKFLTHFDSRKYGEATFEFYR